MVAGDVVELLAVVDGDGGDVVVEHHQRADDGQVLHRERLDGGVADVNVLQGRTVLKVQRVHLIDSILFALNADELDGGMVREVEVGDARLSTMN